MGMFQRLFKRIAACLSSLIVIVPFCPISGYAANSARQASDDVSKDIGLVANVYCINGSNQADQGALQWDTTLSANSYVLYRSENAETGFVPVYSGTGKSCSDPDLVPGKTYYYQLEVDTGKRKQYSSVKSLEPCILPSGLNTYDNQKGSNLVYETSGYLVGNTYYNYSLKKHNGKNDIYLAETTSSDGVHFGNERNVADSSQNSALANCKIESIHIEYLKAANKVVVWAHWEQPDGYKDGKALVITGTPGGSFTVHHVYNPLGIQVRDIAIFFDDDGTGYLIAAANKDGEGANKTLYIFRMNQDYSDVTEVVQTLFDDQYREFPNLIKRNGYYFLFTSQAAGWYPSSGAYAVTDNIAGKWSSLRSIGNSSTFSSQSGWIVNLQDRNYIMHAYRWMRGSSTSGTTLCPLYFDNGFAFYDYCPYFRYSTKTGDLYPVQQGKLLSQDQPATASIAAKASDSAAKAVDGSYQSAFTAIGDSKKWPFYLQVDLQQVCELGNIQTSWYICKGSEGYYTYTVEGSLDGEKWTKLLDRTNTSDDSINQTYGFNSDLLSGKARYVRLNVKNATLQNNPTNNWYTPTVYEMKIFGTPVQDAVTPKPIAAFDFENAGQSRVPDLTGNDNDMTLNGNIAVESDSHDGNALSFDGNADTFAALPDGLLDGCTDYTISMDVKSNATGNFFTFALGQNENKYAFFKVADDHFRFQTTVDTWRGETGMRYDSDNTAWNSYVMSVNGSTVLLYKNGELVQQTTDLTTVPADMGSSLHVYFGKSFYADDIGFSGMIDNIKIYRCALTQAEIVGDTHETPMKGDVNADGTVDSADVSALQQYLLTYGTLKQWQQGDMDADGILTAKDMTILKHMLLA